MPLNLFTLFLAFLKAGGLTIGDGFATIEPLRLTIVRKLGWMKDEDFSDSLAFVQAMPGIFNLNLAAFVGFKLRGRRGSLTALAGMLLPPLLIILIVATFFDDLRAFPVVERFLQGARPAIVALILLPAFRLLKPTHLGLSTIWIPIGAAVAITLLGISPTFLVLGLTALGLLYGLLVKVDE